MITEHVAVSLSDVKSAFRRFHRTPLVSNARRPRAPPTNAQTSRRTCIIRYDNASMPDCGDVAGGEGEPRLMKGQCWPRGTCPRAFVPYPPDTRAPSPPPAPCRDQRPDTENTYQTMRGFQ